LHGKKAWVISLSSTVVLAFVLVYSWVNMNSVGVVPGQFTNEQDAHQYLNQIWENTPNEEVAYIKTGVFIQSLDFTSSSEVALSGYVWQHYEDGVHDHIKPAPREVGFVFPDQVNSGSDIAPREACRVDIGGTELIGW
jgi:hypothetical protein